MNKPRLIIAGLNGGTGKTITSLGTVRAWTRKGLRIKPYKKGPDYIDAKWLALAAGEPATNLDPYLLDADILRRLFWTTIAPYQGALIEGNRGLFDGKDLYGSCSTAELARILRTPVILAMDCTKMTRTAAAIVAGITQFEEGVNIAGVVLNRTANDRHRSVLRETIEHYTGVPVLGALPKIRNNPIPERHMGLVSDQEYEEGSDALDLVADIIEEHIDVDAMWRCATEHAVSPEPEECIDVWLSQPVAHEAGAPEMGMPEMGMSDVGVFDAGDSENAFTAGNNEPAVRIGYVHDAALWFYYEENLQALTHAGAELVRVSVLDDDPWPQLDALYLGGGFPETMAHRIAANQNVRNHIRALADKGLPIYAECGGFMLLSRGLVLETETALELGLPVPDACIRDDVAIADSFPSSSEMLCSVLSDGTVEYPMAGVFPVRTRLCARPQGLGYIDAEIIAENPFHKKGSIVRGHEFHYSRCIVDEGADPVFAMKMSRGKGMGADADGLVRDNVFASYTHLFALGEPHWALNMVLAARAYRSRVAG